jgi:flagellar basal body-associated protein FliL
MLTVQSAADAPPQPKKSKLSKLGLFLAFLIVIGAFAFAVWHFGSPQSHQVSTHQLYATFDASAPHKKILEGIGKTKVSLLVGKKEDGLFNFV